jgi:hypothetical protein
MKYEFGCRLREKLFELRLLSDHLYLQYYPKEHYPIPVTGCSPSEIQEIMASKVRI